MPSLFELVYSGENAFHITVAIFYTIDFTNAPEIQSILGFESSVLVEGLNNPRLFFLSTSCNQSVVTNDTMSYVLSMFSEYNTFLEFIEVVNNKMFIVLFIVSMKIEKEYVAFNVQRERRFFDFDSDNTTIDGFGWTPWFKLSLSTLNMCIIRSLYGSAYHPNSPSLPDGQKMKVCEVMHIPIYPMSNRTVK